MSDTTAQHLAHTCKTIREQHHRTNENPTTLVSCWSEKDQLNGTITDAFVIIFRTSGCSWSKASGCSMCGYTNDSALHTVSSSDLLTQFDQAMNRYKNEKIVKIFNSGSFFDTHEIKPDARNHILTHLTTTAEKISVESRPEYITQKTMTDIKTIVGSTQFEVGIGLETAHDDIREHAINKGFTFADYQHAATLLKKHDIQVKTYVLIKPPFLTEHQALTDAVATVKKIVNHTQTISFNPVNVQRGTVVEYLWKRHQYRPPWLWSIIQILQESSKLAHTTRLKCDISGGGTKRGAHNCRLCDNQVLKAITQFSLEQDPQIFEPLDCSCKDQWYDQCDIESLTFGSLIDSTEGDL
jgi:radical SAM enzyme (TIGR01210 family)